MFEYKDQTALITGASSGIGASFAETLAARGSNVVLVARSEDKLRALAAKLSHAHGVRAEVIAADLSKAGAGREVIAKTAALGLDVHLLVNNAGFGTFGRYEEISADRQLEEVALNVSALMELTHAALPTMVAKGNGGIINVASSAAFQPVPYMATYGATKAFVLSFSEALWAENRARGIRVLALCPGATQTDFFKVVGTSSAKVGSVETSERVVAKGLRALERGKSYVITGRGNYLMANSGRLAPRAAVAVLVERVMRPKPAPALPASATSESTLGSRQA